MIGKFGRSLRQQWIGALALFLVLGGGTAWALSNNSVKSRHIDNGQVKTEDLAGNAVTGGKIDPDAVKASDIDDGTLGTADSDILPHGRITTSTGAQVFNDNVIETRFLDRIEFSRGVGFNFAADASEIVIETPGVYLVIGEVVWQSNSFGHRETMLSKNSDTVFFAENAVRPAQTPRRTKQQCVAIEPFEAGDTVELRAVQTSGGSVTSDDGSLSVHWLGPATP
jgi:hypothetical protein